MVLLVTPNTKKINYGLTSHEFSAIQPNIYMHLLESCYNQKGVECESIHMEADGYSIEDVLELIRSKSPDEVGVICSGSNPSASTMTMVGAIELCKAIKEALPDQKMFVWGGHPTVLPERTALETGARVIVGDDFGIQPKDIPMVDWGKINPFKYRAHNWHCFGEDINEEDRKPYAAIWTTLGCPYQCEFCCINNVFQKRVYKMRDMKDVIAEIDYLVQNFGIKHLKIMDELFVSNNHRRIDEFCEALIERDYGLNMWCFARTDTVNPRILGNLKAAGVNWIAYGFETVSQKTITDIKKHSKVEEYKRVIQMTKEAGISIIADFIAGFWEDDYDSMEETYRFMCDMNFEFINLYPLFAYPGTPLYDKYLAQGRIPEPQNWAEYSLYGVDCKPCPTRHLTAAQVLEWRDRKYVEYYKRPEYLEMIEKKFGVLTRDHVSRMADMQLERNLCKDLSLV